MSVEPHHPDDSLPLSRLEELLADRAVGPLSPAEAKELRTLLNRAGKADDFSLDLAAAAMDRAIEPLEGVEIPAELIARIDAGGAAWSAAVQSAEETVLARLGQTPGRVLEHRAVRTPVVMGHRYMREWSGWIAAAACLAFGVFVYFQPRAGSPSADGTKVITTTVVPSDLVAPVQKFTEDLSARALARLNRYVSGTTTDLVVVPIGKAAPESGSDVTVGQVYWNRKESSGVVRISNLRAEQVAGKNLQLWVFDSARGQKYPVSGGIVPVKAGQTDILVPLDPSLSISDAAAFVVTLESPGGSIVADRDNMVALGFVAAGEGMAPPPVFIDLPQ